jgi:hypothetical protein
MNVLKHASHIQHILDKLPRSTVWALHGDNESGFSLEIVGSEVEVTRIRAVLDEYKQEEFPGGVEVRINPVLTITVLYRKGDYERPTREVADASE